MKATCLLILVVCWSMDGSEAWRRPNWSFLDVLGGGRPGGGGAPGDNDALKGLARMVATDGGQSSNEHDENDDKDEDRFIW